MRMKHRFYGRPSSRLLCGLAWFVMASALTAQVVPFPDFADPADKTARAQYLAGNFVQAEALYSAAWKARPNDAEVAYVLGRLAAHREDWTLAVQFLAQAIKLQPEIMQSYLYYSQAFGEIMRNANIFEVGGKVAEFKAFIDNAAMLFPNEPDILQLVIQFHINAPGILGGNRETAHQLLPRLKALSDSMGLRLEAMLADVEGHQDQTNNLFAQSASHGQARTYLAWVAWLVKHQRGAEAQQLLMENRNKVDRPELMRFLLGRLSADTNSHAAEGLAALDDYLSLDWRPDTPTKAEAWFQKARILLAIGRKTEASQAIRESTMELPGVKRYQDLLKSLGG